MSYLGRRGASAALTSADIPDDSITAAKIVDGAVDFQNELGFLENKATTQNLSGTYSTERMYLNDSYTLTGDVNVTGHLALGSIADEDIVITQDSTERTITGSGTLEAGNLLQDTDTHRTSVTGMTGELGSEVGHRACGFFAYLATKQTGLHEQVTSATGYSIIQFSNTTFDTHSGFQTSGGNQYKYVIPTGQGGIWLFNVGVLIGSDTDSIIRGYQVMLFNGSTALEEDSQRYGGNDIAVVRGKLSTIASVSAGDVIEVRVQTNTTTNAALAAHTDFFSIPMVHMNNVPNRGTIFNGTKLGIL